MKKHFSKIGSFIRNHKVWSLIIAIVLLGLIYMVYSKLFASPATTQYIYGTIKIGTVSKTVTGSGQVSAENQLDVTSEASGRIIAINAKVGQTVQAGDLIATLDSRDALLDLENAKIAYAKLTEAAKPGDVTNSENNVSKAYSDAFAAISNVFLHFPTVAGGLKDMLYSQSGYLSDQASGISETGKTYRNQAGQSYERANTIYNNIISEYRALTKTSPASAIEQMIEKASDLEQALAEAVKDAQNARTFIANSQPEYYPSAAATAHTSLSTWSSQVASDLSAILSSRNTIDSAEEALRKLTEGADALDVRSQQLSLEQKRRAYEKYFVRAPFAGVIGRIPVDTYDLASNGTAIATISSSKKITTIALNEVDAVQIKTGQRVELTFDAIDGLKVDGTVTEVDLVGTASQGVVTYNVKIAFDGSDTRIRAGMSIDATIVTEEKAGVVVVPAGAIKTMGIGKNVTSYVEVQGVNGVERKIITTGISDDTNTEVIEGVNEGDRIIVRTISGAATRNTTPTIFSGIGGGSRPAGGNAVRIQAR